MMKDDHIFYPSDVIIECKRAHEMELKQANLTPRSYDLRAKALRYYDLLLIYNDIKDIKEVMYLADEDGTNTWQYISSAQTRVKRYIEEQQRG